MPGLATPVLVADYLGGYGRADFGAAEPSVNVVGAPFGHRPALPGAGGVRAVQWLRPGAPVAVLHPSTDRYLLLHGPVTGPVTTEWVQRVAEALDAGRYAELAAIPGELSGCLVTPRRVVLFRSVADSMEGLLYRRDGRLFRWSTDPTDLLDPGRAEFDQEAIWRSCRGDDVFIYGNLTPLLPGQIVVADEASTTTVRYDHITPIDLPKRTPLEEYAELAWELILDAVRPYAAAGRVGVMLSGGLDSVTVLAALVEAGADVVAYHQDHPDLGESAYATAACDRLGVKLVPVPLDTGDGYLSEHWRFAHPYAHQGFRGLEQVADRVRDDGIAVMTWGRDGDVVFGPTRYGLHTVLAGDLPWREKVALCQGLVSSGWPLPSLARSLRPSYSLLNEELTIGPFSPPTDFLTPMDLPDPTVDWDAAADYIAEEHTTNLALWWPRGIQLCSPLGAKELRRLVARMPHAYRMLPYRGRLVTKPVLRLILSGRVPPEVWRRYGRGWFEMPHKEYVLNHHARIADLIGRLDSRLVEMDVVDPARLAAVLADRRQLQRHAKTLICAAMTELFLRGR